MIETERKLLKEAERVLRQNLHNSKEITDDNFDLSDLEPRKSTPTKFIYPLEGEGLLGRDRKSTESKKSADSSKKDEESTSLNNTNDTNSFDSSNNYNKGMRIILF